MLKTNSLKLAPFDSRGNLLHYADPRYATTYTNGAVDWRPNEPMELRLTIDHVRSGRSAKYTVWLAPNGTEYPMFISDLIEMLRDATIVNGRIAAMFRVRKRGQNFGLCYDGKVTWTDDPADTEA